MLINCVEDDGRAEEKEGLNVDDVLEEYHTANELFELMAKNHPHNFDVLDNKSLTTRDLVILYENVDLGTKLMSNANECSKRAPNQYVETIIYNDDLESEDSDAYEIYSHEDLHNMFSINNERIEIYSNMSSFENSLCHKFGNTHMKSSNFSNEYEKHFLFNDSYIKEQLQSFHAMTDSKCSDSAVLPTSLLDYICCKRLEDNYNFYMDNIISHVQNTIEQLKRISNGDYLTDRVKEKWREVEQGFNDKGKENNKIIALSNTCNNAIPIEGKNYEVKNTWDEIVHSEMDVRSLAKLLQKKIIVQIPKVLCGSFGIFNKDLRDNLITSYKKSKEQVTDKIKKESSLDVLQKLQRPNFENMNNSVIVLKTSVPSITRKDSCEDDCLTIEVTEVEYDQREKIKIVELDDNENEVNRENLTINNEIKIDDGANYEVSSFSDIYETDTSIDLIPTDELGYAIHRLNIQSSVLEENEDCCTKKKKSPTRVRIKSPYENKTYILEERKRKRLLEIRERREKKKLAMNENCKISKHKYGKGAVMAQSSNSVTKLSITNKSFYNSIYGHTNIANKNFRNVITGQKQENIPNIPIQGSDEEFGKEPSIISPEKNGQKYINRSYYLDDADTEVMYLQMNPNNNEDDVNEILTPSTSVLSSDVGDNVTGLKNLINPSTTDLSGTDTSSLQQNISLEDSTENTNMQINCQNTIKDVEIKVPSNTPKLENGTKNEENKKMVMSVECRKSIDKIYDLMKKVTVSPNVTNENKANKIEKSGILDVGNENTIFQGSDSGTSLKLQLTSSNPSSFGFEKENPVVDVPRKFVSKKTETSTTVIPKVIISSKFHAEKNDNSKMRKENKKPDNPLKAISQLLHEIDNVQKTRHKIGKETKTHKKVDNITVEDKSPKEVSFKNTPREIKSTKHNEQGNSRFFKPLSPTKAIKFSQQTPKGDKAIHKKKLSDIIDEVKELRGEAVRGPSKRTTRIDDLAQPKKSYVQAHHEDYQNKYSKNFISRVQKIPATPLSIQDKNTRTNYKNRQRVGAEIIGIPKQPNKIASSLAKPVKSKRSADSSPVEKEKHLPIRNILPDNNHPDSLKKKMVAVETYLENHYGRVSPTYREGDKSFHKSRVPLIPKDIDIASMTSSPIAEESTTIGNKLHNIINSKINTTPLTLISPEYNECTTETESNKAVESLEDVSKCGTTISTSDHPVDIFEDKTVITAVACISKEDNNYEADKDNGQKADVTRHELQEFKSSNELQMLENALYRQMSNGTFQKRLRIKNLTLTPKQSMQQVFVLQSGDTKSLIVKSTLSQKIDIPKTDTIPKLNVIPVMPRRAIKFKLPTQIATVGYVFPKYKAFKINSNKANHFDNKDFAANLQIMPSKNNGWADKTVQCFKGSNERQSLKQNTDAIGNDLLIINTSCPKNTSKEPEEQDKNTSKEPKEQENRTQQELKIPSTRQDKIISQNEESNANEFENVRNKNSENFSDSTSLDILVGLLNEIKKITTCQSNLVPPVNEIDLESKELKVILNNSAAQDNSVDHSVKNSISISSLDYQPRVRPSNFSLYLQTNIEDYVESFKIAKENKYVPPSFSDKEINVQITPKELVHRVTEVPSRFFPITVNRSTDVIKSLIALVNKTSNESVSSYSNCHIQCSNSTLHDTTVVPRVKQSQSNAFSKPDVIIESIIKQNKTKNILNASYVKIKSRNSNILKKNMTNERNCNALQESDPLLKMKRDVLVTLYSILVLTVFAALTFPEIIYHV